MFEGYSQPNQWKFDKEVFWVQIHNMLMVCMTKGRGSQIGESIGRLVEANVPLDGVGWGI